MSLSKQEKEYRAMLNKLLKQKKSIQRQNVCMIPAAYKKAYHKAKRKNTRRS